MSCEYEPEDNLVDTVECNGYTAYIYPDQDATPPSDWDNFGSVAHWHSRYNICGSTEQTDPEEFGRRVKEEHLLYLPLGLYDHSGLALYVGYNAHPQDFGGWDSAWVGFLYATPEKVREEYSCKRISRKTREKALALLRAEVETWNMYYGGEVYNYDIVNAHGEVVDTLCDCYGYDYVHEEVKAAMEAMEPSVAPDEDGEDDDEQVC